MSYWLITESGKIISKTSVEHVTRDDYLQVDQKAVIDAFNTRLEESLDDAHFAVDGEGDFDSMYLDDIDNDLNSGVTHPDDQMTPSTMDYGDMNIKE